MAVVTTVNGLLDEHVGLDIECLDRIYPNGYVPNLQVAGQVVSFNARLLDTERVGQGCVLASPAFERVAQSSLTSEGRRAPALRFGDPRVMALLGALCIPQRPRLHPPEPSRPGEPSAWRSDARLHQQPDELRPRPTAPERDHRTSRGNQHLPAHRRGQRVAIFYTKIHDRLLRPLLAADTPPAPLELRQALHTIDRHVHGYIDDARLGNAAGKLKTDVRVWITKERYAASGTSPGSGGPFGAALVTGGRLSYVS